PFSIFNHLHFKLLATLRLTGHRRRALSYFQVSSSTVHNPIISHRSLLNSFSSSFRLHLHLHLHLRCLFNCYLLPVFANDRGCITFTPPPSISTLRPKSSSTARTRYACSLIEFAFACENSLSDGLSYSNDGKGPGSCRRRFTTPALSQEI
ncbi:unnamed protein product, partial [Linum tenue]